MELDYELTFPVAHNFSASPQGAKGHIETQLGLEWTETVNIKFTYIIMFRITFTISTVQ